MASNSPLREAVERVRASIALGPQFRGFGSSPGALPIIINSADAETILAALDEREWRPIESAPKDGTPLDLWVVFPEPEASSHRWPDASWDIEHNEWKGYGFRVSQYAYPPMVTHFRLCSSPPTQEPK